MSDLSPLSGVKRTLDFGAVRAAFDPKATFMSLPQRCIEALQLMELLCPEAT